MEITTDKVAVTYEQILQFRNNAAQYQMTHQKERNQFLHALSRALKFTKDAADDYTEALNELQVKYGRKDEKTKSFILDSKENYTFDEDGKRGFHKAHRALLSTLVNDVAVYHSDFVPKDINYLLWAVFHPFVLADEFPPEDAVVDAKKEESVEV